MIPEGTVFVIDDDRDLREALCWMLEGVGLKVEIFANGGEFLAAYDTEKPGCLVIDVRMPGMSGLELQDELAVLGSEIPVIIITGYGDVPTAVRAMKQGAVDFIEKPFSDQILLDRIYDCLKRDANMRSRRKRQQKVLVELGRLTPRERQVMELVVAGRTSKAIAQDLEISAKTVEVHRARVMRKLNVANLADLIRLVRGASESPADTP